mgnify:FL=1
MGHRTAGLSDAGQVMIKLSLKRLWIRFRLWQLSIRRLGGCQWYQYLEFGNGLTNSWWSSGSQQNEKQRVRTESFLAFLESEDLFTTDDVIVDIGSNAGLFSLVAAQRCKQVWGVEVDKPSLRQAKFLKGYWKSTGKRVDNVIFLHGNIMDHLDLLSQATVIFASKVLHHALIGDRVFKLMEAIEQSPVRLIVMQGHSGLTHLRLGEYGEDEGMRDLVMKHGFDYRLVADVPKFPIAIANR